MELVTPGFGLLFWTTLSFLIVLFLLKKMAWKPILEALKERENSISEALKAADKAKMDMARLKADNDKLLNEARAERDAMMKEARETRNKIIEEAKDKAKSEADKLIVTAQNSIENQKNAAIAELKNQVAEMSLVIAEKILMSELSDKGKQEKLIEDSIKSFKAN